MLRGENLYKQQNLRKGHSTSKGCKSWCLRHLVWSHCTYVGLDKMTNDKVWDVVGSHSLLHLVLMCYHYAHTEIMLTCFIGKGTLTQTNMFSDNSMQVGVLWLGEVPRWLDSHCHRQHLKWLLAFKGDSRDSHISQSIYVPIQKKFFRTGLALILWISLAQMFHGSQDIRYITLI